MSNIGKGAPVMGGVGGVVLQCQRRRESVRRTPIESHDARRTGSPRRQKIDAGGGEVVRQSEDGADMLSGELGGSGGQSGWRRKMERKGSEVSGWRLLKVLGGTGW
jgi:hypothetical protein